MEGRLMIRLFDLQSYYFSDSDEYDEWLTLSAYMYLQSSGYSILAERQMVCCDCFFLAGLLATATATIDAKMRHVYYYYTCLPPSSLLPPTSHLLFSRLL